MDVLNDILKKKFSALTLMHGSLVLVFMVFVVTHMVGWIVNWSPFELVNPNWVSMKLDTSIVFSSILLVLWLPKYNQIWAGVILGLAFASMLVAFHGPMADFFHQYPFSKYLETPAVGSIASFYVITMAIVWNAKKRTLSNMVTIIGLIGTLGYILSQPFLYAEFGRFEGMPLHTCVLLVVTGLWLKD